MKYRKKTVRIYLTGGLGNQLFQLANAMNLSKEYEILVEEKLGNPKLNNSGFPEICSFELPPNIFFSDTKYYSNFVNRTISYILRRHLNLNTNLHVIISNKILDLIGTLIVSLFYRKLVWLKYGNGVGYSEIVLTKRNYLIVGYFQTYKSITNADVLRSIRSLKIKSENRVIQKYRDLASLERPLIVHFRLGDYKLEKEFGVPDNQYYENAIGILNSKFPNSKIWIFSDEAEVAIHKFPKKYEEEARWIETDSLNSAEILEIMKLGVGYVLANSTFSWWAAVLSSADHLNIIAPKGWFKFLSEPKQLILPSWNTLQAWN